MFNITVEDKNYKAEFILCKILIGNFEEYFLLDISRKSLEDYKIQWLEAIERLEKGFSDSILLISAWKGWVLHKEDNIVYITENIFKEDLFNCPYEKLGDRENNRLLTEFEIQEAAEEGIIYGDNPMLFSEWEIDFSSLLLYKKTLT